MTRKDLLYIAIILAILTIAWYSGQRQGRKILELENQNTFLQQQIQDLEAQKDSALSQAAQESSKRQIIVQAAGKEQGTLKAEIRRLKAQRLKTTTPPVSTSPTPFKIDSSYLLANCDSLVEAQNSLIVSLDNEKIAITNSFSKELTFTKAALESQTAIATAWEDHAKSNDKKLRRTERRKKVWRGIATVATVGLLGIFVGSQ